MYSFINVVLGEFEVKVIKILIKITFSEEKVIND